MTQARRRPMSWTCSGGLTPGETGRGRLRLRPGAAGSRGSWVQSRTLGGEKAKRRAAISPRPWHEVLDVEAADGRVEKLDGVGQDHRMPRTPDGGGDLQQAARVGGHQEVGARGDDVRGLAGAELAGRLGVEDVVDPGR